MNQLLPYRLKDTPEAIFNAVQRGSTEAYLENQLISLAVAKQPMSDNLRRRISWRYWMVARLIDSEVLSEHDRSLMVQTPTQAMNVVAFLPHLLPIMQDLIQSSCETAEQLFWLGRMARQKDGTRLELGLDEEDLLARVSQEPARRMRLLDVMDQSEGKRRCNQAIVEHRQQAEQRRTSSPAWALEWLSWNQVDDERPLDGDLGKALAASEEYAFLAMYLLRKRGHSPDVWAPLEASIRSPRWAYQAVRAGLLLRDNDRAIDILIANPPWLVEWLVEAHMTSGEARRYYLLSAARAFNHELISDLHHWQISQMVQRMPPRDSTPKG